MGIKNIPNVMMHRKNALSEGFIIYDTETTGMPPGARLVEIGALKIKDGEVVDQFESLVWPECPIPENVIRIHGIDNHAVRNAPTADQVLHDFFSWANGLPLMGHNISFDASMVACEAQRYQMPLPSSPLFCTLKAARKLLRRESHALQSLVDELNLPPSTHHRAIEDARHTWHVFQHMMEQFGPEEVFTAMAQAKNLSDHSAQPTRISPSKQALQEAAMRGHSVEMQYKLSNGTLVPLSVTPRFFWSGKGSIMMEALCHRALHYKTYRLDRVQSAQFTETSKKCVPKRTE